VFGVPLGVLPHVREIDVVTLRARRRAVLHCDRRSEVETAARKKFGRALAACVRGGIDARASVTALVGAGEAEPFLEHAGYHRVVPFVRPLVLEQPGLDEPLRERLRESAVHEAARALRIQSDLVAAASLLDAAGIRWMVIKGPVLAELCYGDPLLRTYSDLDLLVDRNDFARAVEVLEAEGAELQDRNWELIERERRGQLHFRLRLGTFADVHWHLLNRESVRRSLAVSMSEAFERARSVGIAGIDVRTLDPIDTLIHVAMHATTSGGDRLLWLADVRACVVAAPLDWRELVDRARRWRVGPLVGLALDRSRRAVGTHVPDAAIGALFGDRGLRAIGAAVDAVWPPSASTGGPTPSILWAEVVRQGWAATASTAWARIARTAANRRDDSARVDRPVVVPTGDASTRERFLQSVARDA